MAEAPLKLAVVGVPNAGKSSLINALRGLTPSEEGAAPVGVTHTTLRPCAYSFMGAASALTRDMGQI